MDGVSIIETAVLERIIATSEETNRLVKKLMEEKEAPDPIYNTKEAAVRLRCSTRHLAKISPLLNPSKHGKCYKYKESDIVKFLNQTKTQP
jgi:hypothetical protein